MPLNQLLNLNLVDGNDIQAKRGIFRNRSHLPAPIVRSKLTSKMKPNRRSKNFSGSVMENDSTIAPPQSLEVLESNVVEKPSSHESVGLVLRMEQSEFDQTTKNVSETLLSNRSSVKFETHTAEQIEAENSLLFDKTIPPKSTTFIKDEFGDDIPSKKLTNTASPVVMANDAKTQPVHDLKIGDYSQVSLGNQRTDLFETELKTYSASLRKYDQDAKDVIDKFTESLNKKGNIIRRYEEELSLFNSKVSHLQKQLEESLERTKQLESIAMKTTISHPTVDLISENEKLKEMVKKLDTKLAKRDLHIFNLKEVLALETNKIKELNKAQEEINQLQCDNIDKSREISVMRDKLKYAAKMRLELTNEYDEKIVKLKKLLAIREYLLIKEKS